MRGSKPSLRARAPINIEIKSSNRKAAVTILDQQIAENGVANKDKTVRNEEKDSTSTLDDEFQEGLPASGRSKRSIKKVKKFNVDRSTEYSGMTG